MVDHNVLAAKLNGLANRIERVRAHARSTATELAADVDALELVSFNLLLAVQCCVDVAAHVIADEEWTPTGTLGDAFARLAEHGVVSPRTRDAMKRAVGLRNIVAHAYGEVDPALVHAASTVGLADLDGFAKEVATWLVARMAAKPAPE